MKYNKHIKQILNYLPMKICKNEFNTNENDTYQKLFSFWDFPLSDFQKWAIYSINEGNDTMVCAPTGSGKTLPAEFAIHRYHKLGKKIIYTTPIKALSNEKFYDLSKKFPNISFGLLTGDNKFNPEADVVIMTTEILLNTLKKKKVIHNSNIAGIDIHLNKIQLDFDIDFEKELGIVIFDEIHYINDKDRGKIWEQSIMFLPKNVSYLGLSATIDAPENLCKWSESNIGASRREIYLCISNHRNVPLEHYSFVTIPDSNFKNMNNEISNMIKDAINKPICLKKQNQPFEEINYHKVRKVLKYINDHHIEIKYSFVFNQIIDYLFQHKLLPALTFIFSRKQCYIWANYINRSLFEKGSKIPSIIEKKATNIIINKLPNWKEYVELPEFKKIVKLLQKGIAVHHSGVTPVFREMIELLYNEGVIKLLIATETFAVGINMGIKSVVFAGLKKYDGSGFRYLYSHEYGQASGRAGRRGKDIKGYVFHLNNIFNSKNNNPDTVTYRTILSGNPQTLRSKFHIDFKLILSLLYIGNTDFSGFIHSSMLTNEINKQQAFVVDNINKLEENRQLIISHSLRTDKYILQKYSDLMAKYQLGGKKKQIKNIRRDITNLEEEYNYLKSDYTTYKKLDDIVLKIKEENYKRENIDSYVNNEISLHLDILIDSKFIKYSDDDYRLLLKGSMAANIHEIHSLAMAEILNNHDLNLLSVEELVSVLSIFTGVRLRDEDKYHNINNCNINNNIKLAVKKIVISLNKYYDIEVKYNTNFTQSYDIQYDMCEFMYNWCYANNEQECRVIYDEAKKYDIYVGEFIKAILKINNICSELEKVCEIQENIELLKTLSEVREKTLKSIATNQSLYL